MNILDALFNAKVVDVDPNDVETMNLEVNLGEPIPIEDEVYPEKVPVPTLPQEPGGYEIYTHIRWYGSGVADATGVATIVYRSPGTGVAVLVDRVGTICSQGNYTQMVMYEGPATDFKVLDVSTACPDIADNAQPVWIEQTDTYFVASGMVPGTTLAVTILGRQARKIIETGGV